MKKATFVHSSAFGSYTTPCDIVKYGRYSSMAKFTDPISKEVVVREIKNTDLTFKKEKKAKKEESHTFVSVPIERDLYFKILQCCIDRQETIDEFFSAALKHYINAFEEAKKAGPKALAAFKKEVKARSRGFK